MQWPFFGEPHNTLQRLHSQGLSLTCLNNSLAGQSLTQMLGATGSSYSSRPFASSIIAGSNLVAMLFFDLYTGRYVDFALIIKTVYRLLEERLWEPVLDDAPMHPILALRLLQPIEAINTTNGQALPTWQYDQRPCMSVCPDAEASVIDTNIQI